MRTECVIQKRICCRRTFLSKFRNSIDNLFYLRVWCWVCVVHKACGTGYVGRLSHRTYKKKTFSFCKFEIYGRYLNCVVVYNIFNVVLYCLLHIDTFLCYEIRALCAFEWGLLCGRVEKILNQPTEIIDLPSRICFIYQQWGNCVFFMNKGLNGTDFAFTMSIGRPQSNWTLKNPHICSEHLHFIYFLILSHFFLCLEYSLDWNQFADFPFSWTLSFVLLLNSIIN